MKKFIYILTSIILACTSCTGELTPDNGHKKDGFVLTIYNAPLTKAIDNTGEAYERELRTLDIFFYPKGETANPCVFYHHEDLTNTFAQTEVSIYVVEDAIRKIFPTQNLCDIFVIANLPESVKPDDAVFEAGHESTRLDRLEAYVLQNDDKNNPDFEAEYDAINKPFVMAGLGTGQRDSKKNAAGTISLVRASSKITLSVAIPKYIEVKKTINDIEQTIRMVPTIEDNPSINTMNAALHNGSYKGYLSKDVNDEIKGFYLTSDKQEFTYSKTLPAIKYKKSDLDSIPERRVYTCEVPFYTYAREWAKGAADAPYMTFEMKWGADKGDGSVPIYETYYYQILINGADRTFLPNHWYDMFVNVGVIGSTIEIKPIIIDHLSFFVLDWSDDISGVDHPDEDVVLQNYTYLNVQTKHIELENITSEVIHYKASHKIGVKFDEKGGKSVYGLDETTSEHEYAFYIDNHSGKPVAQMITDITLKDPEIPDVNETNIKTPFTDNNNGKLTFSYTLDPEIVSPAYVFITIWLDVDGDGVHDDDEILTEDVSIVIYPAIYIIGDESEVFSVFINGNYNKNTTTNNNNISYSYIAGEQVGKAFGYDENRHMHIINVSSFSTTNHEFNFDRTMYSYLIGDPRSRTPNKYGVQDGGNGWVKAKDVNGTERFLENYYPTSTDNGAFRIIAPKFRISSKLAGYSHCSPKGAEYRCASYQEDGYPAGRWRLPTTAEILFVINLQKKNANDQGKIQELFVGSSNYASATHTINYNNYVLQIWDDIVLANNKTTVSVRCVYDEWYWGSEKEAIRNTAYNNVGGYEFTWGDEPITW